MQCAGSATVQPTYEVVVEVVCASTVGLIKLLDLN